MHPSPSPDLTAPPRDRDTPLVELSAIAVDVDRTPVLRGLDLVLDAGRAAGIVGPNGSGKTTLLEVAATLRRPSRGAGQVLGADVHAAAPAAVRRRICLVGHQPALYPQLTLRENLRFVADLFGRSEQVVERALSEVGLRRAADRRVSSCSLGMTRRADLARVWLVEPRLLLLDEAHAGLDPAAAGLIGFLVGAVRARGGGALVVSHDRGRLDALVDSVWELSGGRLASAGVRS